MDKKVIVSFYLNQNQDQAKKMAAYMKDQFPFLGIQKPKREQLYRSFLNQVKITNQIDWQFVFSLWEIPEREFQYLAIEYLITLQELLASHDLEKLRRLITTKPWWDTIDSFAGNIVGGLCKKNPCLARTKMLEWAESDNIWLVRVAILFQLKYKEETDTQLLQEIILKNNKSKEFFIAKAIGWILREYSKTNKGWVKDFIEQNSLQPLSVREGSKYISI